MSKNVAITIVLLLGVCSIAGADVTAIQLNIAQALSVNAEYDHSTGTATWSGGDTGWALTDEYGYVNFGTVSVTGSFTDVFDSSPGTGLAKASFSTGGFTATASNCTYTLGSLVYNLAGSFEISAALTGGNKYRETELYADKIDGRAVVTVTGFSYNDSDISASWEGGVGSLGGVVADITLDEDTVFGDYDTDDYLTNNVIITLYADESIIPEPATMGLLGLGGLLLARRRR
ncbi:MAG: PEP-CTERM sorting domain-containing protein [Sedimentisphaerales bacterium]|nr:PEP-CTERM sorting domain-containing protein [Sedimentisphaerales bacterium]